MSIRPDARAAALLVLSLFLQVTALAQSAALGPGPFKAVTVTAKGITFTVDTSAGDAARFAGSPEVAVVVDGAPVPFDKPGVVKKAGAKLKQTGGAGGRSIDQLLPEGQQRRMTVRNGDGRTTELDVTRRGKALAVDAIVRGGGGGSLPPVVYTAQEETQGASDSTTDLRLRAPGGSGLDVRLDLTLPATPAGAKSFEIAVVAAGGPGGDVTSARMPVSGAAGQVRMLLAAGSHRLVAEYTAVFGSLDASELTVTRRVDLGRTIAVSESARSFEVQLPAFAMPSLQSSTVNLTGAQQFDAPAGGLSALVTLASAAGDGSVAYAIAAAREVGSSGAVAIAISAPAGQYTGAVTVLPSTAVVQEVPAASYHAGSVIVQSAVLPGTIAAAVPPVTRVAASISDPNGVLPRHDPAHPGAVAHVLSLTGVVASTGQAFSSSGIVLDASAGFSLYYPTGAVGIVFPVLDLDGSLADGRASEGTTLTYDPGMFFLSAPARVDLVVPALPRTVSVAGRVLDPQSGAAGGATVGAFSTTVQGLNRGTIQSLYVAGEDGRFALELPAATTYTLTATYAPSSTKRVYLWERVLSKRRSPESGVRSPE